MTARDDIEAVAGRVCNCATFGHGHSCPIHTQADYEASANAGIPGDVMTLTERLTRVLGCHPGTRENDGTPCASGLHSPALWGADGCTWVAEVAECLGEMGVGT